MERINVRERLKERMDELGMRQIDLVNACQPMCQKYGNLITRPHVSQWLSGRSEPSQNKIYILAEALNVSEAWLMGYDVPKEREQSPAEAPAPVPEKPKDLLEQLIDVLTEEEKKELAALAIQMIGRRSK